MTESGDLLRNSVVSYNSSKHTIEYSAIFDGIHEKANTLFYDGVISPPIVSLVACDVDYPLSNSFTYIDLIACSSVVLDSARKYIFYIRTQDPVQLANYLYENSQLFSFLSISQLIAAFTTNPAQVSNTISSSKRLLWQGLNLIDKRITPITKISVIDLL